MAGLVYSRNKFSGTVKVGLVSTLNSPLKLFQMLTKETAGLSQ